MGTRKRIVIVDDSEAEEGKGKTKGTNKSPFLISGGKLDILYFE
jgi:hypothetical protein